MLFTYHHQVALSCIILFILAFHRYLLGPYHIPDNVQGTENTISPLPMCVCYSLSRVWLCDPMNFGPSGSCVHGILQARVLEWVVNPFSRGSSWPRDWTWISCTVGRFFTIGAPREAPAYEWVQFVCKSNTEPRYPTNTIGYIVLHCNSFIMLFTQVIHKKQIQKIKKTFLLLQCSEKYSSRGQQLA